ncbi:MAG: glycosyl hydrolase [Chitinophagaceae bacterium]
MRVFKRLYALSCLLLVLHSSVITAQSIAKTDIEKAFLHPPVDAKPWVFWYWMQGAVSKQGIRVDLEAMKQVGIGGAYLMPIKDTVSPPLYQPTARQLTPEWWQLVSFAMQEAKRLDLQLAMHVSDGFALAGGPWITPALSMQKLVWTKTYAAGGKEIEMSLTKPETIAGYYKDISVVAYPGNSLNAFNEIVLVPSVTTSNGTKAPFLCFPNEGNESFKSDTSCWIQYKYPEPFTCRSIRIHSGGNNYQAQRLIVQTSDDGIHFTTVTRLESPRHGWQDTDEDVTNSIPSTTAKYFRFVYNKEGSEPGAEDLDAAKWKPSLKISGIYLSDEPVIHQYESKNGSIWRVSKPTTIDQVPSSSAVPLKSIIDITDKMDTAGNLRWTVPPGNWVIVRMGHTSTGHTNATGGGGKGLECDKFNPAAIKLQFDNWFAKAFTNTNKETAKKVLTVFHVDSWECGSQNWSPLFRQEFKKRRGYDLLPYLVVMTGVPVQDAATSEKFLHDVRQTIAELINDVFFVTLNKLAHAKGCRFSAESVAPTMVSDGMLHYKNADMPMGEFWLNSPTHDKPNDMLDAISGAHVYGKNIIQAEAFTSVRMNWGEYPGMLKAVGDRNFALGINKMVLHVFTHNPWIDRKPGMTLDGVGLYFQRDQTWFRQSKEWIAYLTRCQALLQLGKPVVDIAVFTGEELPRRSLLPDRLANTLPGIFGAEKVAAEKKRLANIGQPLRTIPDGVANSANMADPEDWIDPLNGYAYDSFNPDALTLATVKNGRIVLPGGASYAMLVIPGKNPLQPDSSAMSIAVAKKLAKLVNDGATILLNNQYDHTTGLKDQNDSVKIILDKLFSSKTKKGRMIALPYTDSTFDKLGLPKDIEIKNQDHSIAWTHRVLPDADIYFISNQKDTTQAFNISLRTAYKRPHIWYPASGYYNMLRFTKIENGRTVIDFSLPANGSAFIVFKKGKEQDDVYGLFDGPSPKTIRFSSSWKVQFDKKYGGPDQAITFNELKSWTEQPDSAIKYYSGTAVYSNSFLWDGKDKRKMILLVDSVYNMASVKVNGVDCGTMWTPPYFVDITKAIKAGSNEIKIEVANTWHNRLIRDQGLPVEQRVTWTTAPFRLNGKALLPAGLVGKIMLRQQ